MKNVFLSLLVLMSFSQFSLAQPLLVKCQTESLMSYIVSVNDQKTFATAVTDTNIHDQYTRYEMFCVTTNSASSFMCKSQRDSNNVLFLKLSNGAMFFNVDAHTIPCK